MSELTSRLSPTGCSSNVELTKSNKHSNEVELDPLTGATKTSDYSRKLTERVQSDVEKLKDGSIHRHRYKLHESNENKTNLNQSTTSNGKDLLTSLPSRSSRLSSDLPSRLSSDLGSTKLTDDLPYSSRLSSKLPLDSSSNRTSSSRLRNLIKDDDDDDDDFKPSTSSSRIKDYDPIGARLASELHGISVKDKPISFNYEQSAKRRAHEALLREIDDEDEKFRTLPPTDKHRYRAKEQMFANDWTEKDLRYLSKEGRQDLIRPIRPAVHTPEQPFKHKRKSNYGKFVEGF